ncbi:MAG TPA: hypothetical protein VGX68_15835 [Thermoanaerobaculia bacterium]|jgi:hypothetical protein|nr:hypothetical protein [Thermoanaerobaculia bacterium]
MPLWPVVQHALLWGLLMSAVLFAFILAVVRFNPEIMLQDYPPDIRARYGPMSERTKRQRIPVAIVSVLVLLAVVAGSFLRLPEIWGDDVGFLPAFVHLYTMFTVFNVLDLLVMDWLMVRLQPRFIVLPGTEGMAGYQSYWFHFRGFLIGLPITLAASLLFAPLAAAVL